MATIVISSPLALTRTPVSTGRMSSRDAARATTSTVSAIAWAGIVSGCSPSAGNFGKSSAGRIRRWKLEPPLRISTSRSDSRSSSWTDSSPSERESSASRRPGRRTEPGPSASASRSVCRPISRSVAERLTLPPSSTAIRIPDSDWVAARVETARETTESFETSSSLFVLSFN